MIGVTATMRLWVKAGMFLAAYAPLWGVLWWRHFGAATPIGQLAWPIMAAAVLPLVLLFAIARSRTWISVTLESRKEKTSESLNYIIPYTLAIPSIDYGEFTHMAILTIVMITLFTVYASSNLLYVNPILYLLGFRVFQISTSTGGSEATVIAKRPPVIGRPIHLRMMAREVYWWSANG